MRLYRHTRRNNDKVAEAKPNWKLGSWHGPMQADGSMAPPRGGLGPVIELGRTGRSGAIYTLEMSAAEAEELGRMLLDRFGRLGRNDVQAEEA